MARLTTIEALRAYTGVQGAGKEAALQAALDGAEAFAERYTGRRFAPEPALVNGGDTANPVTKTFSVRRPGPVRVPDLRVAVGVSFNGGVAEYDPLDATDDDPSTDIYLDYGLTLHQPPGQLSIEGRWGFLVTPPDVTDAVLALASRRYHERLAAFSDAVQTPEGGVLSYFRSLPASVKGVLDSYRTPRVALV